MSTEWTAEMKQYFKGLKRTHAGRKNNGELSAGEGKTKLTPALLKKLAEFYTQEGDVTSCFTTVWSWNLMCRAFNLEQLSAPALSWEVDAIACQFGVEKNKKDGDKVLCKHVYANPFVPEVR